MKIDGSFFPERYPAFPGRSPFRAEERRFIISVDEFRLIPHGDPGGRTATADAAIHRFQEPLVRRYPQPSETDILQDPHTEEGWQSGKCLPAETGIFPRGVFPDPADCFFLEIVINFPE